MFLRVLITYFLLLQPTLLFANDDKLVGNYRCTGDDFLNHSTFDEPTTLQKKGDTYLFEWQNKNIKFYGTAILLGDTLSAIFWPPAVPSATPGIVTYKILPNGDLQGRWAIKNGSVTGKEYCHKLP